MMIKKIQGVYKLVPEVFVIIRYCALCIIICAILFTVDYTNTIGLFFYKPHNKRKANFKKD